MELFVDVLNFAPAEVSLRDFSRLGRGFFDAGFDGVVEGLRDLLDVSAEFLCCLRLLCLEPVGCLLHRVLQELVLLKDSIFEAAGELRGDALTTLLR